MKRALRLMRWVVFWGLPVAILFLIFRRIDLVQFKQSFAHANGWLVADHGTVRPRRSPGTR